MARVKYEAVYKQTYNEVPAGGLTNQVLKKKSNTNYDVQWSDESGGISTDEKVKYQSTDLTAGYLKDKVVAGAGIELSEDNNKMVITATGGGGTEGEANLGANVGTGTGVYRNKSGVTLNFKSLVEGSNISITNTDADEIVINSTGGGGFTQSYELAEDVAKNDFVEIRNGLVYKRDFGMGYESTFTDIANRTITGLKEIECESLSITNDTFLVVGKDTDNTEGLGLNATIVNVYTVNSNNTITKGTPVLITTSSINQTQKNILKLSADKFILVYSYGGNLYGSLLDVTAGSVSILNTLTIDSGNYFPHTITKFDDNNVLVSLSKPTFNPISGLTDANSICFLLNMSGGIITSSTALTLSIKFVRSSFIGRNLAVKLEDDYIVLMGQLANGDMRGVTIHRDSPTTITEIGVSNICDSALVPNIDKYIGMAKQGNYIAFMYYNLTAKTINYIISNYISSSKLLTTVDYNFVLESGFSFINQSTSWNTGFVNTTANIYTVMGQYSQTGIVSVLYCEFATKGNNFFNVIESAIIFDEASTSHNVSILGASRVGNKLVTLGVEGDTSVVIYDVLPLDKYRPVRRGTLTGYMAESGTQGQTKNVGILGVD